MKKANGKEIDNYDSLHDQKDLITSNSTPEVANPPDIAPPSRRGRKAIMGHFDPAVSRQLKQIGLDNDTTMQDLLSEALNDLFAKHGKPPIA